MYYKSILFGLFLDLGVGFKYLLFFDAIDVIFDTQPELLHLVFQLFFIHLDHIDFLVLSSCDELIEHDLSHQGFLFFLEYLESFFIQFVDIPFLFVFTFLFHVQELLEVSPYVSFAGVGFGTRRLMSLPKHCSHH